MSNTPLHPDAAAFCDTLTAAAAFATRLKSCGQLSDYHLAGIIGCLNASMHTLAFGMPAGSVPIENLNTGRIFVTHEIEAPLKRQKKG